MNGSSHVTNYCIKQHSCWLAQSVGHEKGHPMNFQLTNNQLRWRHPWKSSKSSTFLKVLAKNWEENSTKNAVSMSFVQFRFRLSFPRFPFVFRDRGKSLALQMIWIHGALEVRFYYYIISATAEGQTETRWPQAPHLITLIQVWWPIRPNQCPYFKSKRFRLCLWCQFFKIFSFFVKQQITVTIYLPFSLAFPALEFWHKPMSDVNCSKCSLWGGSRTRPQL